MVGDRTFDLLKDISNFHFIPSNILQPFAPKLIVDGKPSLIPADLSDQQLDDLEFYIKEIENLKLKAFVADVLWLRRKDPKYARIAVTAYKHAGIKTESLDNWPVSMELYERAIRLARQIEPRGELPQTILSYLEGRVFYYDIIDDSYFSCRAMELLAEFRYGKHVDLAAIAGRIAEKACKEGKFRFARDYYEAEAKHLKLAKEVDKVEVARVAIARSYCSEAEACEKNNNFMAAHACWGDAIRAYRDRRSLQAKIPELQKRYSVAGSKVRDEMRTIQSDEIDITKYVQFSRDRVCNLPWEDAFYEFVSFLPLIDPLKCRKHIEDGIKKNPLCALIDANIYDESGRKTGVRPSAFTDDDKKYEKAIVGFMEQQLGYDRSMRVQAHIAPALQQIMEDHDIFLQNFSAVLDDSVLIPLERRELFYQAFEAGFRWDFLTALHILIPQVENGLRHLLEQKGIKSSNVDNDGVEEVWGLERILNDKNMVEIIGEEFVFELKSLLVERLGSNFRHLFAHGMLHPDGFKSETALYLWWVILRLAAFPTSGMKAFCERKKVESEAVEI